MAIPSTHVTNFNTLLQAAQNQELALMECRDIKTGEPRYVICAVNHAGPDDFTFVPFGHLSMGNPYEEYLPLDGEIAPEQVNV